MSLSARNERRRTAHPFGQSLIDRVQSIHEEAVIGALTSEKG